MAKTKRTATVRRMASSAEIPPGDVEPMPGSRATTGRYLVLFRENATASALKTLRESASLATVASSADFEGGSLDVAEVADSDVIVFDKLGVAVCNGNPQQMGMVSAAASEDSAILAVEPERMNFVSMIDGPSPSTASTPSGPISLEYLRGFRDAVNDLYDRLTAAGGPVTSEEAAAGVSAPFNDNAQYTWGLQATRVDNSRRSGSGIRVVLLDTGLDFNHPDFFGRVPAAQQMSFVPGQTAQDGHGHGTHTAGTACGILAPKVGRRYGIAYDAQLFIGKVLSNAGSGPDGGIIAGINWAVTNRCQGRLDVAGVARSAGRNVLTHLRELCATRPCGWDLDHRRRRQRQPEAIQHPAGRATSQLPLHHGRRRSRFGPGDRFFFQRGNQSQRRRRRHRRAGRVGLFELADADPQPNHQRHEHGRRRMPPELPPSGRKHEESPVAPCGKRSPDRPSGSRCRHATWAPVSSRRQSPEARHEIAAELHAPDRKFRNRRPAICVVVGM